MVRHEVHPHPGTDPAHAVLGHIEPAVEVDPMTGDLPRAVIAGHHVGAQIRRADLAQLGRIGLPGLKRRHPRTRHDVHGVVPLDPLAQQRHERLVGQRRIVLAGPPAVIQERGLGVTGQIGEEPAHRRPVQALHATLVPRRVDPLQRHTERAEGVLDRFGHEVRAAVDPHQLRQTPGRPVVVAGQDRRAQRGQDRVPVRTGRGDRPPHHHRRRPVLIPGHPHPRQGAIRQHNTKGRVLVIGLPHLVTVNHRPLERRVVTTRRRDALTQPGHEPRREIPADRIMQRAQPRWPPARYTGPAGQFLMRPLHISQTVRENLTDLVGDLKTGARRGFN
ncbi:hypothetical protein SCANM63S_03508 [Streptomyces canarius]